MGDPASSKPSISELVKLFLTKTATILMDLPLSLEYDHCRKEETTISPTMMLVTTHCYTISNLTITDQWWTQGYLGPVWWGWLTRYCDIPSSRRHLVACKQGVKPGTHWCWLCHPTSCGWCCWFIEFVDFVIRILHLFGSINQRVGRIISGEPHAALVEECSVWEA